MVKGTIRVIYGPGNGKSASAVGYGIIGALRNKKVIIVQYLKGILDEGGMDLLKRMEPEMKVFRFERSRGPFSELTEEQKKEECLNLKNGFNFAKKVIATGECDVLILDEVLGLVDQGVISEEEFILFLESFDVDTDLIMTGRVCPEAFKKYADYISYINNEK